MSTPPFEVFNETDVREEVIAPLLRQLGYQSGTDNDIIREQLLRYPRSFLGRKKPQSDPMLRGKADYILEIQHRLRWVIEAKSPEDPIGDDEIEQAWTYANHPEVRAVYFALCNGRTFSVYRTDYAAGADPVLSLSFEELESNLQRLANVLGPEAVLRDFPHIEPDPRKPIGPGLRSVARITSGAFQYDYSSLESRIVTELQYTITRGAIERLEDGRLEMFVETRSPLRSLQEFSEHLKLDRFALISESSSLSSDSSQPTIFTYEKTVVLPAGEVFVDLTTWQATQIPCNTTCHVRANARGRLSDRTFVGGFGGEVHYVEHDRCIILSGSFKVHLA